MVCSFGGVFSIKFPIASRNHQEMLSFRDNTLCTVGQVGGVRSWNFENLPLVEEASCDPNIAHGTSAVGRFRRNELSTVRVNRCSRGPRVRRAAIGQSPRR